MNEPLRQAVERVRGRTEYFEFIYADADQCKIGMTPDAIRELALDLRTILAALSHPLLGGDLGSDPEDLSRSAAGEREGAPNTSDEGGE